MNCADELSVSKEDASKLLDSGDGTCALLFLHILRNGGKLDIPAAAQALGQSADEICSAASRLQKMGVSGSDSWPADIVRSHSPAKAVASTAQENPDFSAIIVEAQRIIGRSLSAADLSALLDVYHLLGKNAETVMLLINHCAAQLAQMNESYGQSRTLTVHYIQKEAGRWAEKDIISPVRAEEFLASVQRINQERKKLLDILQIPSDRRPTSSERKYMDSWLAMGFSADALEIAYERTIIKTNHLAWAYMDRIVHSWYEKKLFTVESIEKNDSDSWNRCLPNSKSSRHGNEGTPTGSDDRKTALNKMRKEQESKK